MTTRQPEAETTCVSALPRCPDCGEVLRQHVLWFDEFYADHDDYQWPRVQAAASSMKLLLFVGRLSDQKAPEAFVDLVSALRHSEPAPLREDAARFAAIVGNAP